jgi:hypothetical protein
VIYLVIYNFSHDSAGLVKQLFRLVWWASSEALKTLGTTPKSLCRWLPKEPYLIIKTSTEFPADGAPCLQAKKLFFPLPNTPILPSSTPNNPPSIPKILQIAGFLRRLKKNWDGLKNNALA